MLILANVKRDVEFEVSRVNERVFLRGEMEDIVYKGVEVNIPCNYYVTESSDGRIEMCTAREARVIVVETEYESGTTHEEADVDDLILAFGNKRSVERVSKRDMNGRLRWNRDVRLRGRTQILPEVNPEARGAGEYFTVERMFPRRVVESFSRISLNSVVLHGDLARFKQNMKYKTHFLLADCIIKLMEKKYITSDSLSDTGYESFFEVIRDDIEGRRLTPLCRDRLAMLCYILLLQIEGRRVVYRDLPDFGFTKEKVVNMFKCIGCTFSVPLGMFKQVGKPRDVVEK